MDLDEPLELLTGMKFHGLGGILNMTYKTRIKSFFGYQAGAERTHGFLPQKAFGKEQPITQQALQLLSRK
ncbi:MAG: hypothetical protein IPK04_05940 [Bdellovibrionales bacterium]|nr:hypothetical protein [Bdellovibrionales bacterium]